MPQFLVELEDGRKFNVESDIAPTDDDINDFLNQGAPPAPVSDDAFQSPMETGTRAAGLSFATGPYATMAAIGTVRDEISGFIGDTAAGIPRRVFDALSVVPRTLAPLARDVVEQNQEAIAPDSRTNPKAATVGGVIGDIPNLVVSGLVNPAIPLMQGGVRGFDAGIDQANEMGLESPAERIALGTAFGGVEALIEKAGGIGSKAAKDAVLSAAKRTLGQNLVKLGKSTGVEAGEEFVTGAAQDSLSANFAPNTYDTAPLNPLTPDLTVNPEWLARRGYDALGGAVGGVGFGLTYLGAERFKPTPTLAPVADPLAAAAASFPTQPTPSPPTAQVSPPPLPTQPPVSPSPSPQVSPFPNPPVSPTVNESLTVEPPASVNAAIPTVPQRGPATVDEGIVGSTPAAGALSPSPSPQVPQFSPSSVPLATRKVPVIEDAPYGGRDVLDFVNDNPIVIPQIAIGGDMDWAEKAGLPKTYAKFLTLPGDTGNINEVAQDAYDLNIISEPTPDALMAEIQKTIESRESYKADAKSQQSQMSQAEKARVLFDKAVTRAARRKTGTQRVPIDSMNKGDTITLGGETMTVVAQDVNDDGFNNSVTLRSESGRLGTVTLDAATTADLAVEGFEKAPPPEDTSGTWADDVIRGSMETPFIGIDPVLMAAYTVKGAQLIREGFTTFAQWSAEMLRRFGDKVRNYLQGAWQAARKTSQRGSIGGDPLDTRGRGNAMASTEGAAQSNEPSPGGLTEAGAFKVKLSREDYASIRSQLRKGERLAWHGSPSPIKGALRLGTGENPSSNGVISLSSSRSVGHSYGSYVAAYALKLGKPLVVDYDNRRYDEEELMEMLGYDMQSVVPFGEWLKSQDYDGVVVKNIKDHGESLGIGLPREWKWALPSATLYLIPSSRQTRKLYSESRPQGIFAEDIAEAATQKSPTAEGNISNESVIAGVNSNGAAVRQGETPPSSTEVNPDSLTDPRAAEGTASFKNLNTSGTTAGFLNTDIVNEAVDLIRQGFTDFANWSRAMITRFGRAIQEYLQGIWQAATTRTMPRMGGGRVTVRRPEGGFIQPGSPSPADPSEVKLTQDTIAAEREAAGRDALPTGGQFTVEQLTAAARAEVQKPGRVQAILDDILAQQRPATPLEHYTLLNFKGQLDAELAQAEGILSDPATTEDDRGDAAARKREADAMKDKLEVVAQISGSRAGAALGVRRFGLDREDIPSLNKMVADITIIMDPTGRTPLPPEERAKIEEMHKTIIDTKAAADTQQEEGVGGAKNTFNLELEKLLKEAQAQIAAQEAALKQAALDLTNAAKPRPQAIKDKGILKAVADRGAMARERLRAKGFFGGTTNVGIDPSIILDLAEAGMGFLAEGADFTIRMVQEFGEKIRPFLGQIRDKSEQLLRGETQKKTVSDVKSKAQETVRRTGKAPDNLARQFALAHIIDHLERQDPTLSAEKIAKLVADDLQEFFPGIQVRQARDLISGYGKSTQPSKEEARVALRDLSAQMQKLTQLEALLKKEPLLKSGPQRQEPSARLRELQKQVEQLKKDTGYTGRSREDELKSIRDRIQKTLENQIEELQRVLAGQGTPTAPRQRQVYDANLQALKTLRNSLKVLVAELPQHRLASELRRNTAAEAAAKASEDEYKRRIKAKEWKAQGKIQGPQTQAVTEARAAAAAARQQFLDLKRAAQPNFDPNAKELAAFKKRIQGQIDKLNERIAKGEFDPVKRTPRQIKHDADSAKLLTELNKAKRAFIDAKVAAKFAKMGIWNKGIEKLRTFVFTARSIMAGGEFSGIGRQGLLKALTHPVRFAGDLKAMMKAFKSEAGETEMFMELAGRPNAINGRYKRAKLALHNPEDYSDLLAEGAARSKLANKIPWFSHTGRAYTALLSHMRADLFDSLVAKYERRTKAEISDSAAAAIAEFVNDSTGSGKLGIGNIELRGNQKDLASLIFFSPSFMASRLRLLTGASLLGGNLQTRAIIGEEYIRIMAGYAALFALAAALQGDDEEEMELDPRGSGWLKMQFGATSVDLMAGLNSMATFLTRTITGETKTKDGKIKPIRGEDVPMGQSWIDIAQRFARGKLSPGAAFVTNRLTGTDPMGNAESMLQGLQRSVTPITAGAIYDIYRMEPAQRQAALIPAALLGIGTNTRAQ